MQEVLMVYRDVCLHSEGAVHDARREPIYTVSVDEKPSVQAIYLTAPDLPPVPGKAVGVGRDYEDVRRGTVSILAGIDLHSGKIFANVEDRHRSSEFIALLRKLDEHYPPEATSAWCWTTTRLTSPKRLWPTLAPGPVASNMSTRPSTGSWLNLIEYAFSKMACTFLRHIRVGSVDELKARILQGVVEFDAAPVVFRGVA
jgi:hypothetical protein